MNDIKTDCFAYECGHCNALKSLECKDSNCNFYKSMSDFTQQIEEMYGINDVSEYFDKMQEEV